MYIIYIEEMKKRIENRELFFYFSSALLIDAVRWDVCNLPMRDQSVDAFVTDLVSEQ